MKYLLFISIILLAFSSCRPKQWSQDIMATEAKKQTELMEKQVHELKRIANALEKDTVKSNPFIYNQNQ